MHSTARVYRNPRSPYWHAHFQTWDAKAQDWKLVTKSTRCTDEAKALSIARQYERLALKIGGANADARVSREFVTAVLNSILDIAGQPTFDDKRRWNEYSLAWLKLQRDRVSARTMVNLQSHVRQFTRWLGKDSNIALDVLTGDKLQQWYSDQIAEGRKPASVNNTVKALRVVFERARSEGFCQRNPAELILKQHDGASTFREPFSLPDLKQLLAHLRAHGPAEWLTMVLLGICTGQRHKDCAKARAEQFTMSGQYRVWNLCQGKTKATVAIPLVEPLASHIEQLLKTQSTGFLSPTLAKLTCGSSNGLAYHFGKLLDTAKVDRIKETKKKGSKGQSRANKTFHSLRHTANSMMANAGISQDIRRKILGHTNDKMNAVYTHMDISTNAAGLQTAIADVLGK